MTDTNGNGVESRLERVVMRLQTSVVDTVKGLAAVQAEIRGIQLGITELIRKVESDIVFAQDLRNSIQKIDDHFEAHVKISEEREAQLAKRVAKAEYELYNEDGLIAKITLKLDDKIDKKTLFFGWRALVAFVGFIVLVSGLAERYGFVHHVAGP